MDSAYRSAANFFSDSVLNEKKFELIEPVSLIFNKRGSLNVIACMGTFEYVDPEIVLHLN